jgi:26S proteasome regulatory subunit N1
MPAPTLPVTPVPSEDPKRKKKEAEDDKGKVKEDSKDSAKQEEGEELVSHENTVT